MKLKYKLSTLLLCTGAILIIVFVMINILLAIITEPLWIIGWTVAVSIIIGFCTKFKEDILDG